MNPEIFGTRIFMSPDSAPIQEPSPLAPEHPHISHAELLQMNESRLLSYLTGELREAEIKMYGVNDAEAKIIFLGGGPKLRISDERTFEGVTIYKNPPELGKLPEIFEFIGAANKFMDGKGGVEEVVSEAADLVYNFAFLSKSDTFEHAPDYIELIQLLADSLGWTPREALLVGAFKYHQRFVHNGGKDPLAEDQLMKRLVSPDLLYEHEGSRVHPPTPQEVDAAFNLADQIRNAYLIPRYHQIRFQKQRAVSVASA